MEKRDNKNNSVRYIVFKEADTWYAAGLELNIVESGDDPDEALFLLFEAIRGCVNSAKKIKAPQLLRQKTDPEYEKMWTDILDRHIAESLKKIGKSIYAFGEKSLVTA